MELERNGKVMPLLNPPPSQDALNFFVGMVYATMLSLLISVARNKGFFDELTPTLFMLFLIVFFAQDWISRELGNRRIKYFRPTAEGGRLALKLVLDVVVVFFLHLASLRLVEVLTASDLNYRSLSDGKVAMFFAFFSISAGVWNWAVIYRSRVITKGQFLQLRRLNVPDELIKVYFPRINGWKEALESKLQSVDQTIRGQEPTSPSKPGVGVGPIVKSVGRKVLDGNMARDVKAILHMIALASKSPHILLTPYFLTLHLLILNGVLGTMLLISSRAWETKSCVVYLGLTSDWSTTTVVISLAVIGTLLFASLICYAVHLSPRPQTGPRVERWGTVFLALSVLCLYLILPTELIVIALIVQQLIVNMLMTRFFQPSETRLENTHTG